MLILKRWFKWHKLSLHGRNNTGSITVYHKGGSRKQLYFRLDFYKYIWYIYAIIIKEYYYAINKSFIFLLAYSNGLFNYILAVNKLYIGSVLFNGQLQFINYESNKLGITTKISNFAMGDYFHTLILNKSLSSKYIRTPGNYSKLTKKIDNYYIIKLRSKFYFKIFYYSFATFGSIKKKLLLKLKKKNAGINRHLGIKPHVRGVAMNPIDHPHGGGQGKTSGGRPSCSKWAWYTKGKKTSKLKWKTFVTKTFSFKLIK